MARHGPPESPVLVTVRARLDLASYPGLSHIFNVATLKKLGEVWVPSIDPSLLGLDRVCTIPCASRLTASAAQYGVGRMRAGAGKSAYNIILYSVIMSHAHATRVL